MCLTGGRPAYAQLASLQFHLINTAILFLSREGFRRGCLRSEQNGGAMRIPRLLATAALVLPVGAVTAAATCGLMLRRHGPAEPGDPYPVAVYMQGAGQRLATQGPSCKPCVCHQPVQRRVCLSVCLCASAGGCMGRCMVMRLHVTGSAAMLEFAMHHSTCMRRFCCTKHIGERVHCMQARQRCWS